MKQPLAVIVGDIHFSLYSKFNKQLDDGGNSRAKLLIDEVKRIFEYTRTYDIKEVIFLGDILDSAEVIRTALFNDIIDLFSYGKKLGLNITTIAGNHDYFSYNTHSALHSLKGVLGEQNVIDDKAKIVYLVNNNIRIQTIFCPYLPFGEALHTTHLKGDILFCHQSVDGVQIGSYELVKQKDAINPDILFDKFNMIISGHIHKKQVCKGVIFPGSIAQKDFGDEGIKKYFSVLYDDLSIEYIPTKHPEFYTIDYIEDDSGEIEEIVGLEDIDLDNSFVRVKTSKERWKELSQTTFKDKNVIVDLKPDKKITAVRVKTDDLSDNNKVLSNYLDFVSKNDEWVRENKDILFEKGVKYLK